MAGKYDIIVIGNDFGSLIAAEVSSCAGFHTLLLQEGHVPDSYQDSGYTFNVDPSLLTGLGPLSTGIHSYLEKDLFQMTRGCLKILNPGLQVISPGHRVDLYNEKESLIREIDREFPGNPALLYEFYDAAGRTCLSFSRLAAEYPSLRLPLTSPKMASRFIRLLFSLRQEYAKFSIKMDGIHSDILVRFFEVLASLVSGGIHNCGDGRMVFSTPCFLTLPFQGLFYPFGGKHHLLNSVRERFVSQGGIRVSGCSIVNVECGSGNCEIEWMDRDGVAQGASGKKMIVSAKWKKIGERIFTDKRFNYLGKKLLKRREKAFHPFTLHMGVLDKGIPEKLSEYAIIIREETGDFDIRDIVLLELSGLGDTERAPSGRRALSATSFVPSHPESMADEDLRGTAAGILEKVDEFLPFLKENIEIMDIEKCILLSKNCSESIGCKLLLRRRPLIGLDCLPNKTSLKNVFLAGDDLFGMGFVGEVLSGLNAAQHAIGR